jgi:hypothetical protein
MNQFETLLFNIIYSACDKINAASALLKTKYSWNMAFVTTIIAEEELAKLIILPILWEI